MTENIIFGCLVAGALFCAYRAMIARRILSSAIYLAAVSAATSALLYLMGAPQVAVIELSVGAGLVTVLVVYAISVVGDHAQDQLSIIPRPLALFFTIGGSLLLAWMAWPMIDSYKPLPIPTLENTLWELRVLDVWIQMVLIFSGVLGMLGLLTENSLPPRTMITPKEVQVIDLSQEEQAQAEEQIPEGVA
jgi:uncharacterized MnhB-related membrane protein